MKFLFIAQPVIVVLILSSCEPQPAVPVMFDGTIFVDPDIITSSDPNMFGYLTSTGNGRRQMYDNRVGAWTEVNAILFNATYTGGRNIEIQVNPEFGTGARGQAELYAKPLGSLPQALLEDVLSVAIQKGNYAFGGGNKNILIHSDRGLEYISQGILEETLFHEAAHTSLDPYHLNTRGWLNAQSRDSLYISSYARDNPDREDLAESVLMYFGVTYRAERMDPMLVESIKITMPNRIEFFKTLELSPLTWESLTQSISDGLK